MWSVDRMLVEEHHILHRDISWTNVLINAIHADGNSDNDDDLCDRPFIDAVLGVEYASLSVYKISGSSSMQGKNESTCHVIGF